MRVAPRRGGAVRTVQPRRRGGGDPEAVRERAQSLGGRAPRHLPGLLLLPPLRARPQRARQVPRQPVLRRLRALLRGVGRGVIGPHVSHRAHRVLRADGAGVLQPADRATTTASDSARRLARNRRRDRRQVVVHRPHRTRAFADRGGNALERAVAHVADREHSRHRRLERQRITSGERVPADHVVGKRAVGEDEAAIVERDRATQPCGGGVGTDEAEQARCSRSCGAHRWRCARR